MSNIENSDGIENIARVQEVLRELRALSDADFNRAVDASNTKMAYVERYIKGDISEFSKLLEDRALVKVEMVARAEKRVDAVMRGWVVS